MRIIFHSLLAILLSGCAGIHFDRTQAGALKGKLLVEWINPDQFIFTPDKDSPLTFTRKSGQSFTPGKMYTDGGSIPRPLWAIRSYSPWGYAPAFIVHDWLFEVRHCKYQGHELLTVDDAALVMSEIMKTMMLDPKRGSVDKLTMYAMYEAVKSPIAVRQWNEGKCVPPPRGFDDETLPKVKMRYVIEFP